jgi:hypothetical protein
VRRESSPRRRKWVSTSELPVPGGAPAGVRQAVRRARVARVLGPGLGAHLLEVRGGRRLVLVFRGTGWEAPLASCREEIRRRLEQALGHAVETLEVRGRDVPEPPEPPGRRAPRACSSDGPLEGRELRERLRELGRRLVERRSGRKGAAGDIR